MAGSTVQSSPWRLARRQHHVVTNEQLRDCGLSAKAIEHRLGTGRLHRTNYRGVYAVGRRELTQEGEWMAAVLACGEGAALSHESAGALWGIRPAKRNTRPHISLPLSRRSSVPRVVPHRRAALNTTTRKRIPTTTPTDTLIDLAATLTERQLEAAVNEADKLDLITPERL